VKEAVEWTWCAYGDKKKIGHVVPTCTDETVIYWIGI